MIAGAAALGWWFVPFLAGLAGGAAARYGRWRKRAAVPAAVVVAAAGWALPLAWLAAEGRPVGATARVVAALAGLPPHAAVAIAVTLLVAVLQALAGLWVGWSLMPRPGLLLESHPDAGRPPGAAAGNRRPAARRPRAGGQPAAIRGPGGQLVPARAHGRLVG